MGRCPLLLPLAALVCGILAAGAITGGAILWGTVIATIAGGMAFVLKRYALGVFLIFLSIGVLSVEFHKPPEITITGVHHIEGDILSITDARTSGRNAVIEVFGVDSAEIAPFVMRVHMLSERPYATAGMRVEFTAKVKPLPPAVAIPDAVDLSAPLRRRGVQVYAELSRSIVHVVGDSPGVMPWFRRLNTGLENKLMECNLSANSINMLSAMLLGNDELLPSETRDIYSAAGLAHLLALSGMHIGIIAMLISTALWPLYVGKHNRTRLLLTIAALWFYAFLTALSPSVTRAVVMATVYMFGRVIERDAVSLNSLCLAAIVILLINPDDMQSIGFQLSFSAVAGIILFYPLINRVDFRNHAWIYRLVSYPALSVSAMILTGFVSAFHFHTFPLLFLLSNLAIAPLVPLFVSLGAVVLLCALAGMEFSVLNFAVDSLAEAIDWIASATSAVNFASIGSIYISGWLTAAIVGALILLALGCHYRKLSAVMASLIVAAGCMGASMLMQGEYPFREMYLCGDYRIKNLIVKEGGSCTIYTDAPTEADREETLSQYRTILENYLGRRGIDSLRLAPSGIWPRSIVGTDTLEVSIERSCALNRIVYRRL